MKAANDIRWDCKSQYPMPADGISAGTGPLHVHAIYGDYETIFDIVFSQGKFLELKRRKKRGKDHLPPAKMELAEKFVEEYALRISEKWYQFFVLKADVPCETINKKVK